MEGVKGDTREGEDKRAEKELVKERRLGLLGRE